MGKKDDLAVTLAISILNLEGQDINQLAHDMNQELKEDVKIEVISEKRPELSGRSPDVDITLRIIQLVCTSVQAYAAIQALKNRGLTYIVKNETTGQTIKVSPNDSNEQTKKETKKVTQKPGILNKLLGK